VKARSRDGLKDCARHMRENEAMLKRNHHSIPLGVRYWTFYKRHVLEDAEVLEPCVNIKTEDEFRRVVKPLLKSAPFRGRNNSKSSHERLARDMMNVLFTYHCALFTDWWRPTLKHGLGLVALQSFTWTAEREKQLFGVVCGVEEADFEELQRNH